MSAPDLDKRFPRLSSMLQQASAKKGASMLAAEYGSSGANPTSWRKDKKPEIAEMLWCVGQGDECPLLDQIERSLEQLDSAGIGLQYLNKINTVGQLVGPRVSCVSGAAEIVGLAWLSRTGALLDSASMELATHELPVAKSEAGVKTVDAMLGDGPGVLVPCDIKSAIAHTDQYLRDIERETSRILRGPVHLHQTGIASPEKLRQHQDSIVNWLVSHNASIDEEWCAPDRSISLRVVNSSSGFRSAANEHVQFLKRFVAQTKKGQLSTVRPSMLMQVRTEDMGHDYFVDEDLLRGVFLESTEAPHILEPLFGAVPPTLPRGSNLETDWVPFRPYLSAFIYLDGTRDEAYLVENPHCKNPISSRLRHSFISAGAKLVGKP